MYSIKSDLGVLGNSTLEKALLVKGDAIFKQNVTVEGTVTFADATFTQLTVTGTAAFADITASGDATLTNLATSGNTVLGDASTDTVVVNGTASFAAPVSLAGDVTQAAGTASFNDVAANTLTVDGLSKLDGNLEMKPTSTATLGDTDVQDLTVNGVTVIKGTSTFEEKATFGDVEINGTLSGTLTMEDGSFTNLTVSNDSTLNKLSVTGNAVFGNNISGLTSTATLANVTMNGQAAIITFNYNDVANPSYIKSSIQPYKVSTQEIQSNIADITRIEVGSEADATSTNGLHSLGKATMDYVAIKGNTTIGTSQPQLTVAGASVFSGTTTVGDLVITGSVTGLTFDDITTNNLTVSGASSLQNVTMSGNLTALNSTATIQNITMNGQSALLTFNYTDSSNPSYIKSSIQPYKVSSHEFQGDVASIRELSTGVLNDTIIGHKGLGVNELDYLHVKGNSTIGTSRKQLLVDGDSQFAGTTTVNNIVVTGTTTGITADVAGADITPNSVTATAGVEAATLESTTTTTVGTDLTVLNGTATIKDLVVTGTTTGVTVDANVDGLDIKPASVETTSDIIAGADLTVAGTLSGASSTALKTNSISVTGTVNVSENVNAAGASFTQAGTGLDVTNNAHIGGTLTVDGDTTFGGETGTTTIHDLVVTGTTTGVTVVADVDGLDIKPASVESTGIVTGTNLTASGTVSGATVQAGALTVTNDSTVGGDLTVTGTLTAGTIDLSGSDISANKLTSTTTVDVGSDLTVSGTATVTGAAQFNNTLTVTGLSTLGAVTASDVQASGVAQANSLNVTTDGVIGGDLSVTGTLTAGTIDLGAADISANSLTTVAGVTVGSDLAVAGNVTGTLKTTNVTTSGTLEVTGASTLGSVTATTVGASGLVSAGTLTVAGAATFDGDITSSNETVAIAKNTAITGDLAVSGTLTAGTIDLSGTAINAASLDTTGNAHVGGDLTVDGTFDLSGTDLAAASLASAGNTTVGSALVLTTGTVTGSPSISGTLTVAGASTVADLAVGGTITKAGGGNLAITPSTDFAGDVAVAGDVTVTGTLTPSGGLDLSSADITANSLSVAQGVETTQNATIGTSLTVGTTLGVTGASTLSGGVTTTTVSASGLVSAGTLTSTGIATLSGGVTTTTVSASGRVTSIEAQVGAGSFDTNYKLNVNGNSIFNGDVFIAGRLNGTIDLSGVDLNPRNVTASGNGSFAGTLSSGDTFTAPTGIFGVEGSVNNSLQVNGNVVATGDFEVGGVIKGTLDQSEAAVTVGSLETALAGGITIGGNGPLVLGSGGIITGAPVISGNTTVGGTFTSTGLATLNGGLTVTGTTTLGSTTLGATTAASLSVTGISTLSGNTTVGGTLDVTGKTTVADLEITGTLTTNVADLVTDSVSTKRYTVKPMNVETTVTSGSWTPDGTSNVYNVTVTGATQIGNMPNPSGEAGSWFIYLTNTDGGAISMGSAYAQPLGEWGTTPGGVTICQIVYCGVGSIYDVFLSQRA